MQGYAIQFRPGAVSLLSLAGLFLVAGCRNSSNSAGVNQEVNVYMWSEYIDPDMLKDFQQQTGLKVRLSVYEATEDMVAKIEQAGGVEQYDVVVMSDHVVPVMVAHRSLQPLDLAKIPHAANVTERFRKPPYDPGGQYTLPYQWGTMCIMYRKDKIGEMEPSWSVLFDPAKVPASFVFINSMRDLFAAALLYQGHSVNSRNADELRACGDLLARAKSHPKFKGFEGSVEGKNKIVNGEENLAIVYNGDGVRGLSEAPGAALVIPQEGSIIWVDAMTIPARAPNPDGANKFINFVLEAKAGAKLSNFTRFASPNSAALPLINEADRNNRLIYPPDEIVAKMPYIEDVGDASRLYDEVWTSVKTR